MQKLLFEFLSVLAINVCIHFGKKYPFVMCTPNLSRKFGWILSKVKETLLRDDRPKQQLRYLHALFVSILHYSDWLSSGKHSTDILKN